MNNVFNFTLDDFSGPLDLLLHLIKESKMDIMNVSLELIMNQYLSIIEETKKMNIDIASEYLVIASELIHLKSKTLLNIKDDTTDSEDEINSEDELRRRLIEYEKYKTLAEDFRILEKNRAEFYTKLPESLAEYKDEAKENIDASLEDLVNAFKEYLERAKYMKPLNTKVTNKELSVTMRVNDIKNKLRGNKQLNFIDLFEEVNKPYIIVTFLAILEMAKNKEIFIKQNKNFENIKIEAVVM